MLPPAELQFALLTLIVHHVIFQKAQHEGTPQGNELQATHYCDVNF